MKSATIILALLASGSAMAQVALHGDQDANEYAKKWYADHARIPDRWWTDQDDPEARCYHHDASPDRDRKIDACLAIVRRR